MVIALTLALAHALALALVYKIIITNNKNPVVYVNRIIGYGSM